MWIAFFAFGAVVSADPDRRDLVFYRSSAHRRLSQIVVSQGQSRRVDGNVGRIADRGPHRKTSVSVSGVIPRSPKEVSNLRKTAGASGLPRSPAREYLLRREGARARDSVSAGGRSPDHPSAHSHLFAYADALGLGFLVAGLLAGPADYRAADEHSAGAAGGSGSAGGVRRGRARVWTKPSCARLKKCSRASRRSPMSWA